MNYKQRLRRIGDASAQLAQHQISTRPSISWHFAEYKDGAASSFYAFAITWTPGTLVLSGDLGECTVTHWNATRTLESAVRWMHGASFDYIMGKSDAKQEFSRDETLRQIVFMANDQARHTLKGLRDERRRYRRDKRDALLDWDRDETVWAVEGAEGHRPALDGYLPDPCFYDNALSFLPVPFRGGRATREFDAPDGFEQWYDIYRYLEQTGHTVGEKEMIFTSAGRRELKDALRDVLENDPHDVADACREMGFDDYYGSYDYPEQATWHFAAFQKWAETVLPTLTPAETVPAEPVTAVKEQV